MQINLNRINESNWLSIYNSLKKEGKGKISIIPAQKSENPFHKGGMGSGIDYSKWFKPGVIRKKPHFENVELPEKANNNVIRRKLLDILQDNAALREGSPSETGTLNLKKLPHFKTRSRIFQRRDMRTKKDYAICLLCDVSGSMGNGYRNVEMAKATVQLVRDLKDISHLSVVSFNRYIENEDYSDEKELLDSLSNKCYNKGSGCNHDDEAIKYARKWLLKSPSRKKILITLSDGHPECQSTCNHAHELREMSISIGRNTKRESEKTINAGIVTIGIGIHSPSVEGFYKHSKVIENAKEIYTAVLPLLKKQIKRTH